MNKHFYNLHKLSSFTRELLSDGFINYLCSRIDYDFETIRKKYTDYVEEARFGVELLSKFNLQGKRVLEIGAGAGMLTGWLLMNGVDTVGIEPSALGFSFNDDIYRAIFSYFDLPTDRLYNLTAEELNPEQLGRFDLICSVNVLEHILPANMDLVFSAMKSVLAPGGMMYHHCPNYIVPFEPHYGIPLIPFFPHITGRMKGVRNEELWKSVNFITYNRVKKLGRQNGMDISFEGGVMKDAFARLETDKEYAARHPMLSKIYKLMKVTGIAWLIGTTPPVLCTPMTFTVTHKNS